MANTQSPPFIRRLFPVGVSVLVNCVIFYTVFRLQKFDTPSETQIAVELQQQTNSTPLATALPPVPKRILRIKKQAEKVVDKQLSKPSLVEETAKNFLLTPLIKEPKRPNSQNQPEVSKEHYADKADEHCIEANSEGIANGPTMSPISDTQEPHEQNNNGSGIHTEAVIQGTGTGSSVIGPGNGNTAGSGNGKQDGNANVNTGNESNGTGGRCPGVADQGNPGDQSGTGKSDAGCKPEKAAEVTDNPSGNSGSNSSSHGICRKSAIRSNPQPEYPQDARDDGVEGIVRLEVRINSDGKVIGTPRIIRSSGNRSLDKAAVRGVKRWLFDAALEDDKPIDSTMTIDVKFQLN